MKTITDVRGFRFWGAHTGVKSKRRDLGIIFSDVPASAATLFTRNRVVAEPVKLMRERTNPGSARAIVVNSGNANACTGRQGRHGAQEMVRVASEELDIDPDEVIIASTGVIGWTFPTEQVVQGIRDNVRKLTDRRVAAPLIANAILTTDTFPKEEYAEFRVGKKTATMGGIAKGSGMIHPDMGTMLAFIVCDVAIRSELLDEALREVTDKTFNMITVDGDTSTNDMIAILCNGEAGNRTITQKDQRYESFRKNLERMCMNLARLIVSDGEGATKSIEYEVHHAASRDDARRVVRTVSNSVLVKTAIFGRDPNWGRILAAAGRAGAQLDPDRVDLYMGGKQPIQLLEKGQPTGEDLGRLKRMMRSTHVRVVLDLNMGEGYARGWGADLSYEYVRINAEYTT